MGRNLSDLPYLSIAGVVFLVALGWLVIDHLLTTAGTNNPKRAAVTKVVLFGIYIFAAAFVLRWMSNAGAYPGDRLGP